MSEKKNIDRLFQEKFKDYEVFPDSSVWQYIEKELEKKKKKRVVPLWLRFSSAAAILLLLVSSYWYSNHRNTASEQDTEEIITSTNKNKIDKPKINTVDIKKEDNSISSVKEKEVGKREVIGEQVVKPTNPMQQNKNEISKLDLPIYIVENKEINEREKEQKKRKEQQNNGEQSINTINNQIEERLNDKSITQLKTTNEEAPKKDILKEIEEQKTAKELINASEINKWSVGSIISPVYYNTLSSGSPIDPSLAENSKKSNSSLSYGLKVNYRLSSKLSLQSGINNLELGYKTANVVTLISSSLLNNSATNIDTNIEGVTIATRSTNVQSSEAFSGRSSLDVNGNLNQSLNYVEIPLEIKYNVLQKKLGIQIIGGFSTYFLYQNVVTATSFGKTTILGEATNLNNLNFSGNLGIDLEYNLSKKLFINVSPMFKYQLHTFSKNSGGFQPYYLGVYTGVNFRF